MKFLAVLIFKAQQEITLGVMGAKNRLTIQFSDGSVGGGGVKIDIPPGEAVRGAEGSGYPIIWEGNDPPSEEK